MPSAARSLAMIAYVRGAQRLDAAIPDDLPYTAGDWLAREIDRLGLSGRVPTPASVIQLHADAKADTARSTRRAGPHRC